MKIVVAPDKYKGCLSSVEVALAIEKGLKSVLEDVSIQTVPMADGGDGTLDVLHYYYPSSQYVTIQTTNAYGQPEQAPILIDKNNRVAIIESAKIIGLDSTLTAPGSILQTTSRGLGEAIAFALEQNVDHIIIGLGGTATNDGGVGMLEALGATFFSNNEQLHHICAQQIKHIDTIQLHTIHKQIKNTSITVLIDVDAPLCGPKGASYVFGPQKGASSEEVALLDEALAAYASKFPSGETLMHRPGAGAAGGLGFALLSLGGQLTSGATYIAKQLNLKHIVKQCDLVITGEGQTDEQTFMGKAPHFVTQLANQHNKRVIIISGSVNLSNKTEIPSNISAIVSIIQKPCSLEEAIQHAPDWLQCTARQIGSLLKDNDEH